MKTMARVAVTGVFLGLAMPALALEWVPTVGGDVRWFDWREEIGGQRLLTESGPLFSPLLGIEARHGEFFAGVEASWGGGLARYDGRLQTGPAYSADAWEEIVEAEWRVGWRNAGGGVHAGYLQRDWRRYIEGSATVSSAEERYRWRLFTVGGEAVLGNSSDWRIAFTLGIPVESHQKVYTSVYDDFTLEPGDGLYWRVALPYRPAHVAAGRLTVEPYYQQHDMEASDPARLRIGGVAQNLFAYQPASVRRELGLTLRLRIGGAPVPARPPADPALPSPR